MKETTTKLKILVFIGSLRSGGKERRLIELLTYLHKKGTYEFLVVLTKNEIHYEAFHKLGIEYRVIEKKWKKNDPSVFYSIYKIIRSFKPDLIHTWGRMQSFYTLPAVIMQNVPLVNSQITAAPPRTKGITLSKIIDRLNFRFSKIVLSNSKAGIDAYQPPVDKIKVIYNGINMDRFAVLPAKDLIREKYKIDTPIAIVMVASMTDNKDYDLFYRIADRITRLREDVTFIGAGGGDQNDEQFVRLSGLTKNNPRIIFTGRINDVEALVNACDIGLLFSNKAVHGEGISNAIIEYMSLAKPVVANDAGGTREIVHNDKNGYLIGDETDEEIVDLILELINDENKRKSFGLASRKIVEETFSLNQMGQAFEQVYYQSLQENL